MQAYYHSKGGYIPANFVLTKGRWPSRGHIQFRDLSYEVFIRDLFFKEFFLFLTFKICLFSLIFAVFRIGQIKYSSPKCIILHNKKSNFSLSRPTIDDDKLDYTLYINQGGLMPKEYFNDNANEMGSLDTF